MKYPIFISGQGIDGTGKVIALIVCGVILAAIGATLYYWWRRG